MKVIFLDNSQDSKEYETENQDLKQIFKIADTLLDNEIDRMNAIIKNFPEIKCNKNYE